MQLNFAAREVTMKLVYYGPALSGKTTNLRALHQLTSQDSRGRLMTLETKDDRTLFFDMLPLVFRAEGTRPGEEGKGMSLRVKVFTVPGQVLHSSTRRLVLQGADGVAFIADSQVKETENNAAAFVDLRDNLRELGLSVAQMPLVIQFNKRDMPGVRRDDEIEQLASRGREPVYRASAVTGNGVLESFFGLLQVTWNKLDAEHQLGKNLGIDRDRFLPMVAGKLGFNGDVQTLLDACVGGGKPEGGRMTSGLTQGLTPGLSPAAIDPTVDERLRLEELVHRDALTELCTSFYDLFGIPVRIYSSEGALLADVSKAQEICGYVNASARGRAACANIVGAVKRAEPGPDGDVIHPCFTGAAYRIIAIDYEGRQIGRLIVGPYLPVTTLEMPPSLLATEPALEEEKARSLLFQMPRAKSETITRLAGHLKAVLDLVLFSGHRALLTSHMHLASVRESYRELEDKNRKLQETYDRLKELDRLKSNFLATVSHELRTPLTSIIGYSEMLLAGIAGPLATEQTEFVQTIFEKGEQLLSLILGLLDLSKLESGTMAVKLRRTDLGPIIASAMTTLDPIAQKKSVDLKVILAPELPAVHGDPERLRQVFQNLVENAIKFTPPGASILVAARSLPHGADDEGNEASPDDDSGFALLAPARALVEVRVIDEGIGIPDREKARVFDAFYQVDSSSTREYGGTGLGLSIVKRLIDAHDGKVRIEDNRPSGAVFVVTLPASKDVGRTSANLGGPLSASNPAPTAPGSAP